MSKKSRPSHILHPERPANRTVRPISIQSQHNVEVQPSRQNTAIQEKKRLKKELLTETKGGIIQIKSNQAKRDKIKTSRKTLKGLPRQKNPTFISIPHPYPHLISPPSQYHTNTPLLPTHPLLSPPTIRRTIRLIRRPNTSPDAVLRAMICRARRRRRKLHRLELGV